MQDMCMICTKHTIGSEIILGAPDELQGDVVMWDHFRPFGDSHSVGAR
jgi:hypothetical protein